jgi:hypothetical protein
MGTFIPEEQCRVPAGAKIVQMKYCELCGVPFSRSYTPTVPAPITEEEHVQVPSYRHAQWVFKKVKHDLRRDRGERLCRRCHAHPSLELSAEELLKDQEDYKAQLPNLDSIHVSSHPIHYERLIAGRETSAHRLNGTIIVKTATRRRSTRQEAAAWKARVAEAFRTRGRLTTEEIQNLIPNCFTPAYAYQRCITAGIKLKRVGFVEAQGFCGLPMRIYVLVGVSPETL